MLGRMTLLDWLIVALPVFFLVRGLRQGGVTVLLSGYFRILLSLALAPLAVSAIYAVRGEMLDRIATDLGVPRLWAMTALGLVAALIIHVALGMVHATLAAALKATVLGRFVDRLIGVPAGLAVGATLAMLVIVMPVAALKARVAPDRQPAEVSRSVLLPIAERFIAPMTSLVRDRLRALL